MARSHFLVYANVAAIFPVRLRHATVVGDAIRLLHLGGMIAKDRIVSAVNVEVLEKPQPHEWPETDFDEMFGADFSRWTFLTGMKAEIKKLAIESWKLAAFEKDKADRESENDLFVHSTIFVLIDRSGTMRGVYESLEPGFQEKIRADIQSLLKENP